MIRESKRTIGRWVAAGAILSALAGVVVMARSRAEPPRPRLITVGVVNLTPGVSPVLDGFKARMQELGYEEGRNIRYIYHGPTRSIAALEPEVRKLLDADIDLLLAMTTPAAVAARKVVEGRNVPVVFAPVNDPVHSGIVASLRSPGGNLTGLKVRGFVGKTLEWILAVAPDTRRVYVPHNPEDHSSVLGLTDLRETAGRLGVELVVFELKGPNGVPDSVAAIPDNADAIVLLPDNLVIGNHSLYARAAIERKLLLTAVSRTQAGEGSLLAYGPDFYQLGRQVARLADQILKGVSPSDLPVETAEFYLTINLKTSSAIGVSVPDRILRQANHVIRLER